MQLLQNVGFPAPLALAQKALRDGGILQVTRWLKTVQPGRQGAGQLQALHSWILG